MADQPQAPLPMSPCCPTRRLDKLASDGSTLVCAGCSRSYRAGTLDDDHEPHVEELMRAPVTPQGHSSGGGRQRRQPKPGERQAIEQRRQDGLRRWEQQQAGALGRPDRAGREKMVPIRMAPDELEEIDAVAAAAGCSRSELLRRGVSMLMGVLVSASHRAAAEG